ncbi:MAG: SH3 domain-containing protein [bacterium]|nr:SH3 domain-containing protein [bacterium]MDY4098745.1 SH3 domain-containing protein [Lachnospiraceae bacterium]
MKKQPSAFFLVFATYLIAGIAAIVMFYDHGSRLSRQLDEKTLAQAEASDAPRVKEPESVTQPEPEVIAEPEPEPEVIAEPEPEPEVIDEPEPEPEVIDEPEPEPEPEKIYYGFTVRSGKTSVRVRKSAERNSSIVGHVDGGDTGYVIEEDGNRTKVVLKDGTVGYIYSEYITVSEIPKKEVPEEYR